MNAMAFTLVVKNLSASARDVGSIPGLGISPGRGNGNPTPVFLPGKYHGQQSLVGYSPWGDKELDTPELLSTYTYIHVVFTPTFISSLSTLFSIYFCD